MGNRAVIAMSDDPNAVGIYLHWNGGRNSVKTFLKAAKQLGVRGDYGLARLTQIIGNYFGGTLSLDIGPLSQLDCDNGDNGLYIIDENFDIVGRKYHKGPEQTWEHDVRPDEMLAGILAANRPFFTKG